MSEGIYIKDLPDLMKKANERLATTRKKAEAETEEVKERIKKAMKKENELQKKLKKAQERVEKMKSEYKDIRKKIENRIQKRIEKETYKKEEVRSGKVTIKEYYSKAKAHKKMEDQKEHELFEETKNLLEIIRKQSLEILKTQKEIAFNQRVVLIAQTGPARLFIKELKDLIDFTDREVAAYKEEIISSDSTSEILKDKLLKCKGYSSSGRIGWPTLTSKEARDIIFDPIFPKNYIEELLNELNKLNPADKVNVSYMTKGSDFGEQISIDQVPLPGRIYKTSGDILEKKNGKIQKRKEW